MLLLRSELDGALYPISQPLENAKHTGSKDGSRRRHAFDFLEDFIETELSSFKNSLSAASGPNTYYVN